MRYLLALLTVFTLEMIQEAGSSSSAPADAPNLIFLLTDDQRWDALGVAGNRIIRTPHLDQLANDGFYFRRAYVTTPICAISRASILSGQYARRHGILTFEANFSDSAFSQTYPALLQKAGYHTGFIGKFGVGTRLPAGAFSYWKGFGGQGAYAAKDSLGQPVHLTDLMGQQLDEFIRTSPAGRPFCLSVSFKAPHAQDNGRPEFPYAARYGTLYAEDRIAKPAAADERYYRQFPDWFRQADQNESRVRWNRRFSSDSLFQLTVKSYYRLISGVDEVVGRLRRTLQERGLSQNTIIVFMSDNGFYLGEYGFSDKWYGHELSIRVPLIIYDPRHPRRQHQRTDRYALNVDIAPTLLTLAGLPIPPQMQGRSLTELMDNPDGRWRDAFFFEHLFNLPSVFIPQSEGVLSEERKYVHYFNIRQPGQSHEEIYDLKSDPAELVNLANQPEGKRLRRTLLSELERFRSSSR